MTYLSWKYSMWLKKAVVGSGFPPFVTNYPQEEKKGFSSKGAIFLDFPANPNNGKILPSLSSLCISCPIPQIKMIQINLLLKHLFRKKWNQLFKGSCTSKWFFFNFLPTRIVAKSYRLCHLYVFHVISRRWKWSKSIFCSNICLGTNEIHFLKAIVHQNVFFSRFLCQPE